MGKQQRITETLERYWLSKQEADQFPMEDQIDPEEIDEIWESCFLVRHEGDDRFRYLYMGEDIIEALGDDLTGQEVCHRLVGDLHDPLVDKFMPVLSADEPCHDESSFMNRHNMDVKYRMCLLPLRCKESNEVKYILGGMKWKAY